jgi:predicted HTH transcriptional regulator
MHPELKKCLIAGESEKLDFKESITNAHKIAKTIVSFANHEGGVILVGIRDNKTIAGIIPEEERFMLQLAVTRYCRPMIRLHYQEVVEGKKTVLFVKIEQGSNKPYKALDDWVKLSLASMKRKYCTCYPHRL